MPDKFPDKHELKDQIERGYIQTDQDLDPEALADFLCFKMWREGRFSYQQAREMLGVIGEHYTRSDYIKQLFRGASEYLKNKFR